MRISLVSLRLLIALPAGSSSIAAVTGDDTEALLFSSEQLAALESIRAGVTTRQDVEIVAAHYSEDTSWLSETEYARLVTLYSHGDPTDAKFPPTARTVKLPENVGKESHVYLTHIVQNYDSGLADWTIFTQAGAPSPGYVDTGGKGNDHTEGGHLVFGSLFDDYVLAYASGLDHYFVASSAVEPKTLEHNLRFDFDRAQEMDKQGLVGLEGRRGAWGLIERCPPSASSLWMPKWIDVTIDPNFAPLKAQHSQCGDESGGCPSLREFAESLNIPGDFTDGSPVVFGQGARFAVSKEVIQRHPKYYYEKLLDQVSHNADPWQGYFYEYLWYHMIASDPNPQAPTWAMCPETPKWDLPPSSSTITSSLRTSRTLGQYVDRVI